MSKDKKRNLEVRIDNARITFRNFGGAEGQYNNAGNRNFSVFLDDDIAKQLEADGWNVRWLDKYEDEPPQAIINVKVAFGNYPPTVILVSDGRQTRLDEHNVSILDFAELETVDLILRGYEWGPIQGRTGIKAYLKTGYFVLMVDELARKYGGIIDSAQEAVGGCGTCDTCDGHCGGGIQ